MPAFGHPLYNLGPTQFPMTRAEVQVVLPSLMSSSKLASFGEVVGTNEVQTLTFGGTPTGGTFTLTFDGYTTAPISWSSTNATLVANIDAALEALPNIGAGGVTVAVGTMTNGIGTITVTFGGILAIMLVVQLVTGIVLAMHTFPSREALTLVRQAFGEDAVVLSTKPCAEGVEVLAMAPESLQHLEKLGTTAPLAERRPQPRASETPAALTAMTVAARNAVLDLEL